MEWIRCVKATVYWLFCIHIHMCTRNNVSDDDWDRFQINSHKKARRNAWEVKRSSRDINTWATTVRVIWSNWPAGQQLVINLQGRWWYMVCTPSSRAYLLLMCKQNNLLRGFWLKQNDFKFSFFLMKFQQIKKTLGIRPK